ncbi:MAG: hypothetical protein GF311_08020 [Candidatus Lokiarchaeota archaeon]|nr:hypothetical protein [Candidatus Lokiarchaeota archaeon]
MEIQINNQKIPLKDRLNLILGDFQGEELKANEKNFKYKQFEDFNIIPLKKFLKYIKNIDSSKVEFDNLNSLIKYLNKFQEVSSLNISVISKYLEILELLFTVIDFNLTLSKKRRLKKELELSQLKEKSSTLSAKTNLLNNLNEQIKKNRQDLKYLEEDFFQINNKKEQLEERINKLEQTIRKLNQERKAKFQEVNKITRSMEAPKKKSEIPPVAGLSNAERIQKLRKEAKEIHYKIRKYKSELENAKKNLDSFLPKYQSYKKDFDSLKSTIDRQENQIKQQKAEIEELTRKSDLKNLSEMNISDLSNIRDYDTIKQEINKIDNKIDTMIEKNEYFKDKEIQDFDKLGQRLTEFKAFLSEQKEDLIYDININTVNSLVDNLREFELYLKEVEDLMNIMIGQINLELSLETYIDFGNKEFFIKPKFTRNEKETLGFNQLTTPEKVFVVINLFITINISLDVRKVLFSNLYLNENFNKRGSLFRTLRKVIPIFQQNKNLKDIELTFAISNLEMKRPIENMNIIKL